MRDGAGRDGGDRGVRGVVALTPAGGKAAYVWFRLLDGPAGEAVLFDVVSAMVGD